MFTFNCEVCGKECTSKTDPANWKAGKVCWDCRNKKQTENTNGNSKPAQQQGFQRQSNSNCNHNHEFDLDKYVCDLLDVYESLLYLAKSRGLEIPDTSICQWATSIMIQKDKR